MSNNRMFWLELTLGLNIEEVVPDLFTLVIVYTSRKVYQ